jgi:P4 family phage/plasmid primase-like protien
VDPTRYAEALAALEYRYRDVPDNATVVVNTMSVAEDEFRTRVYHRGELSRAAAEHADNSHHVWTRISVLPADAVLQNGSRGTETDTLGTSLLWVDLDPPCKRPTDAEWQPWRTAKLAELRSFYPVPSRIEDSGRGYYAFWRIPWTTEWERVKRINKWLASVLGGDHCYDLARVLRLPGTLNPGAQRYACVVEEAQDQRPYSLDNFQEADLTKLEVSAQEAGFAAEPLPLDIEQRIEVTSEKLLKRVRTEVEAQEAGAPVRADREGVDRSRNDLWVAVQLLRAGLSSGQVYSILTHPTYFVGSKFRDNYDAHYVEMTLAKAVSMAGQSEVTNHVMIAQRLEDTEALMYFLEEWYRYNSEVGVYEPADAWLAQYVQVVTGLKWRQAIDTEVRSWLKSREGILADRTTRPLLERVTNVQNGMLDWRSGTLEAHGPAWKSLGQVNARWDPTVDCQEVDRFVGSILRDEDIPTWWQWSGYCLFAEEERYPFHAMLALIGPPATGKSSLMQSLMLFLGEENCSTVGLDSLAGAGDKFTTSFLIGKLLNADLDASYHKGIKNIHLLKRLSSGDPVMVERKGQQAHLAHLACKLAFVMNGVPQATDADEGFYRRWVPVMVRDDHRFTATNPERQVEMHRHVMGKPLNRSAWLLRSVEGLRELWAAGGFPENQSAKDEFRKATDPMTQWWEECMLPEEDIEASKWTNLMTLWPHYQAWMSENGLPSYSTNFRRFTDRSRELIDEGAIRNVQLRKTSSAWQIRGRKAKPRVVIVTENGTVKP